MAEDFSELVDHRIVRWGQPAVHPCFYDFRNSSSRSGEDGYPESLRLQESEGKTVDHRSVQEEVKVLSKLMPFLGYQLGDQMQVRGSLWPSSAKGVHSWPHHSNFNFLFGELLRDRQGHIIPVARVKLSDPENAAMESLA